MIAARIEQARTSFENLNERERRLVFALGAVLLVVFFLFPAWWTLSSLSSLADETEELKEVLTELRMAEGDIRELKAKRQASLQRYDRKAPPLGSFLEQQAKEAGFESALTKLNDQPEKTMPGFRRRHTKVTLNAIDLKTLVKLLTNIKNSPYPVAVESIRIDHFSGRDKYNIQLGVIAFDRESREAEAGS